MLREAELGNENRSLGRDQPTAIQAGTGSSLRSSTRDFPPRDCNAVVKISMGGPGRSESRRARSPAPLGVVEFAKMGGDGDEQIKDVAWTHELE